ncbi:MAG: glycosyl hydrolase 115 family protein, partial [Alistipes sp.]|nr:glycosyl hydrolase 115 family protein [Alistipes sp.]
YKEVLDVYNRGLQLPDDVTIVWPDDNYGYMKRLSNPEEQKRSGRSGVYYHSSYLGRPHDYLWMNTTSPTLMYEELRKAYDMTADRVWLLNSGDIKSCEFAVDFFLAMARDIDAFDFERAANYRAEWMSGMLGTEYFDELREISDRFYHLAFVRKPEFMGWGYQWATDKHGRERRTDTDFSFANYREADRRLADYGTIARRAADLLERMPEASKACCYQILYYPVKACELLNRMILYGQKNRLYAVQQRAATDSLAAACRQCYDSLQVITAGYNSLCGGKWNHIMTMKQGFAASYFELPELRKAELAPHPELEVKAEGEDVMRGMRSFHALPAFDKFVRGSQYVEIYNKGCGTLRWSVRPSCEWIVVDRRAGA